MQRAVRPGQARALLAGAVGQRDDVVEPAVEQLGDRLGAGRMPVDADLGEDANGQRVNLLGVVPADDAPKSGPPNRPSSASAIWLRAELPLQTNRTPIGTGLASAAVDGRDRALEVDELDLEALQLLALRARFPPLLLQRRGQRRVEDPAFEAAIDEPARLGRGEPEAPQGEDQRQPGEVGVAVLAVAVLAAHGTGQDAGRLVPADSGGRDAGAAGERRDVHASTVDLTVTVKSNPRREWRRG